MTSTPKRKAQRKSLGAYYSPPSLVTPLVEWAVRNKDEVVLDPSCGDGIFLDAAAAKLKKLGASVKELSHGIRGVDLNPEAAAVTSKNLRETMPAIKPNILESSFFALARPKAAQRIDVIVGNLPAELIHAGYAAPVRKFLRSSFDSVSVLSFSSFAFPDVQAEVVLLLCENKSASALGTLSLAKIESVEQLKDLPSVLRTSQKFPLEVEPEKWRPESTGDTSASILDALTKRGAFLPLLSLGKAGIGYVSGANDFFVLRPSEARALNLPEESLRRSLVKARQMAGSLFSRNDFRNLESADDRCLLWLPGTELNQAEKSYARKGVEMGVSAAYKCRVRDPWYRVPGVSVPDAFLTYMSDVLPRLSLNQAKAVSSNTLLNVNLRGLAEDLKPAFVTAFYNSATLLSCERIGRAYGGGVLKLEPGEADRILVPSPETLKKVKPKLLEISGELNLALRTGNSNLIAEIIGRIDEIVLLSALGLRPQEARGLAISWASRSNARRGRTKKSPLLGRAIQEATADGQI